MVAWWPGRPSMRPAFVRRPNSDLMGDIMGGSFSGRALRRRSRGMGSCKFTPCCELHTIFVLFLGASLVRLRFSRCHPHAIATCLSLTTSKDCQCNYGKSGLAQMGIWVYGVS